jgi:hypothetical protein
MPAPTNRPRVLSRDQFRQPSVERDEINNAATARSSADCITPEPNRLELDAIRDIERDLRQSHFEVIDRQSIGAGQFPTPCDHTATDVDFATRWVVAPPAKSSLMVVVIGPPSTCQRIILVDAAPMLHSLHMRVPLTTPSFRVDERREMLGERLVRVL